MVGLTATAYTPDGETPAVETVCDPLTAEGVSQGLYGLCLAFCEAQDIASEDYPITDEELAILQGTPPSGNILNAYNTLKIASDPDMPCIVVDSICPCWAEEELAAIDGMISGGTGFPDCNIQPEVGLAIAAEVEVIGELQQQQLSILAAARNTEGFRRCEYRNNQVSPTEKRFLEVTPGQAAVCQQQVTDHCSMLGF